jgi:hypothetical protein
LNKANWSKFRENLPKEYIGKNVNEMNNFITTSLNYAANISIPTIKRGKYIQTLPSDIIETIKIKRKAKKIATSKAATPSDKTKYNKLNKQFKEEIKMNRIKKW